MTLFYHILVHILVLYTPNKNDSLKGDKMSFSPLFRRQPLTYLLTCLFSGFSGAFVMPLLSLYLIDELHVSPLQMGLLMIVMVVSGVVVSQYFAKRSDAGASRKGIILLGRLGFVVATVILALTRNYYIALATVLLFLSFSACSSPQIFAMGRNYADQHLGKQAILFVTMMRASIAIAWVIAPPVAFLVSDLFGFTQTFLIAATAGTIVFVIVCFGLPDLHLEKQQKNETAVDWKHIAGVPLLLLCMFFAFSANNMYLTSISLYVTQELDLPSKWVGLFMGSAAFIEIPIMISGGYLAQRFGTQRLIFIACISGLLFHAGLLCAHQPWQFLLLQIFNSLFIGINASLGMVVIQDMMKQQIGLASTLFNNSQMLGALLSSLMVALIAQYFSYYAIFICSTLFCALAVLFLMLANQQIKAVNKIAAYA